MNKFVDEHTVLMREFLRNISSNNEINNFSSKNSSTDSLSSTSTTTSSSINESKKNNANNEHNNGNNELKFNCDLIDLGKQLSILHTLLLNTLSNLEKVCIFTFLIIYLNKTYYLITIGCN